MRAAEAAMEFVFDLIPGPWSGDHAKKRKTKTVVTVGIVEGAKTSRSRYIASNPIRFHFEKKKQPQNMPNFRHSENSNKARNGLVVAHHNSSSSKRTIVADQEHLVRDFLWFLPVVLLKHL
jgi:hypothetical protein